MFRVWCHFCCLSACHIYIAASLITLYVCPYFSSKLIHCIYRKKCVHILQQWWAFSNYLHHGGINAIGYLMITTRTMHKVINKRCSNHEMIVLRNLKKLKWKPILTFFLFCETHTIFNHRCDHYICITSRNDIACDFSHLVIRFLTKSVTF